MHRRRSGHRDDFGGGVKYKLAIFMQRLWVQKLIKFFCAYLIACASFGAYSLIEMRDAYVHDHWYNTATHGAILFFGVSGLMFALGLVMPFVCLIFFGPFLLADRRFVLVDILPFISTLFSVLLFVLGIRSHNTAIIWVCFFLVSSLLLYSTFDVLSSG